MFTIEFCEIFKNTLFCRKPPVAASETIQGEKDPLQSSFTTGI